MRRMTRQQFREWLESKPDDGRYELVAGEPVAMSPERVAHNTVKFEAASQFRAQVRERGLHCQVFIDGITVEVGTDTDYGPDVIVNCGQRPAADATAAPNPLIVVEVLSPSTRAVDTGRKLMDYFRLPSIRHYLVVRADKPVVTHHLRQDDGTILTRILQGGRLDLDPPGLTLDIEALYLD